MNDDQKKTGKISRVAESDESLSNIKKVNIADIDSLISDFDLEFGSEADATEIAPKKTKPNPGFEDVATASISTAKKTDKMSAIENDQTLESGPQDRTFVAPKSLAQLEAGPMDQTFVAPKSLSELEAGPVPKSLSELEAGPEDRTFVAPTSLSQLVDSPAGPNDQTFVAPTSLSSLIDSPVDSAQVLSQPLDLISEVEDDATHLQRIKTIERVPNDAFDDVLTGALPVENRRPDLPPPLEEPEPTEIAVLRAEAFLNRQSQPEPAPASLSGQLKANLFSFTDDEQPPLLADDSTSVPDATEVEQLLNAYYKKSETKQPKKKSAFEGYELPKKEEENRPPPRPTTPVEYMMMGVAAGLCSVLIAGFAILTAWPPASWVLAGTLTFVIAFAVISWRLTRKPLRVLMLVVPAFLGVLISGLWGLPGFRNAVVDSPLRSYFLSPALQAAIVTDSPVIAGAACRELGQRQYGADALFAVVNGRPEIAIQCLEPLTEKTRNQVARALSAKWEKDYISATISDGCSGLDEFEKVADLISDGSLRIASISVNTANLTTRDCAMAYLRDKYKTPEALIDRWSASLERVDSKTAESFVSGLLELWVTTREDVKESIFAPSDNLSNFRLYFACTYIREEGYNSDLVDVVPGMLAQAKASCVDAIDQKAVIDTCKTVVKTIEPEAFCQLAIANIVPRTIDEARETILRGVAMGVRPKQSDFRPAPDYLVTAMSIGSVGTGGGGGGGGLSPAVLSEFDRMKAEAYLFEPADLSIMNSSDREFDSAVEGMGVAEDMYEGKTGPEIAEMLGLNWDELTDEQKEVFSKLGSSEIAEPENGDKRKKGPPKKKKERRPRPTR